MYEQLYWLCFYIVKQYINSISISISSKKWEKKVEATGKQDIHVSSSCVLHA